MGDTLFMTLIQPFMLFCSDIGLKGIVYALEKFKDENFVLAGRGFCFLCHALRVFNKLTFWIFVC